MAFRIDGALRFPIRSPTPREVSVWVVKPLRGEWQVLQATELSDETRFSSKIMSPSFALASVIGLSGGVNDWIASAEKRGTGGACWAGTETAAARKISTLIAVRFTLSPMIAISIVPEDDPRGCNYAVSTSGCNGRLRLTHDEPRSPAAKIRRLGGSVLAESLKRPPSSRAASVSTIRSL